MTVERPAPLLAFLMSSGANRTTAKRWLAKSAVAVNGAAVRQFDHPLLPGDQVVVRDLREVAAERHLRAGHIEIVHEDDALLVVDKPAGLLTVASERDKDDTLFVRLKEFLAHRDRRHAARPLVVHRIDEETSGLVLFAKRPAVKERLQRDWANVKKGYVAIVVGVPDPPAGTITSHLAESRALRVYSCPEPQEGAKLAVSHYRTLASCGQYALLELQLQTGRKHQLRVHLADQGHPIAGDARYGATLDPCGRLALHAASLSLDHPETGAPLVVRSPLPSGMARLFPRAALAADSLRQPAPRQAEDRHDQG